MISMSQLIENLEVCECIEITRKIRDELDVYTSFTIDFDFHKKSNELSFTCYIKGREISRFTNVSEALEFLKKFSTENVNKPVEKST